MEHLTEGVLRRMHDEEIAATGAARRHFERCPDCQARFAAIGEEARAVAELLRLPQLEIDARRALGSLRPRLEVERKRRWLPLLWRGRGAPRPHGSRLALAVVMAAVLMVTVVAAGKEMGIIFSPTRVTPVAVSEADFQGLPDLRDYGTLTEPTINPREVRNAAEAESATGLRPMTPGTVPAGTPKDVHYGVVDQTSASFTFNAQKARDSAARTGNPLPQMPVGIDGSTLVVTGGPAVVQLYGQFDPAAVRSASTPSAASVPSLVIAQAKVPSVSSTGVTVKQLEDYLLAQPGVSEHLKAEIRAIGDPATTLPVPVPTGTPSHEVTVQGVKGLFVGDSTGIASAVVWVKNGFVYAVGGSLTESQALAVASSLH